jgi:hypothetical protein
MSLLPTRKFKKRLIFPLFLVNYSMGTGHRSGQTIEVIQDFAMWGQHHKGAWIEKNPFW